MSESTHEHSLKSCPEQFFPNGDDVDLYMHIQAQQAYNAAAYQAKLMHNLAEGQEYLSDIPRQYYEDDRSGQMDCASYLAYPGLIPGMSDYSTAPIAAAAESPSSGNALQFPTPAPTRGGTPHTSTFSSHGYHMDGMVQVPGSVPHFDVALGYDVENSNGSESPVTLPMSYYQPYPTTHYVTKKDLLDAPDHLAHEPGVFEAVAASNVIPNKPRKKYSKRDSNTSRLSAIDEHGYNEDGDFERKRRTQVKVACIHCKRACKKCDDVRPCSRCIRIGLADSCCDAPRKERKKGFKRGPYNKRRDSIDTSNNDWSPHELSQSEENTHANTSPHIDQEPRALHEHQYIMRSAEVPLERYSKSDSSTIQAGGMVSANTHPNGYMDDPSFMDAGFNNELSNRPTELGEEHRFMGDFDYAPHGPRFMDPYVNAMYYYGAPAVGGLATHTLDVPSTTHHSDVERSNSMHSLTSAVSAEDGSLASNF